MVVCWSHAVYNFYGLRVGDGACGTAIACWPVLTTSIAPTYHQNWRGQLNHQNERVSQGQLQLTSLYRLCVKMTELHTHAGVDANTYHPNISKPLDTCCFLLF